MWLFYLFTSLLSAFGLSEPAGKLWQGQYSDDTVGDQFLHHRNVVRAWLSGRRRFRETVRCFFDRFNSAVCLGESPCSRLQ